VLTERLDRFECADGSEIGAAKVMGILELDGDRIVAWRDYFDVTSSGKSPTVERSRPDCAQGRVRPLRP
jgi:limonene-1,2-epoxide hydrolase